MNTTANTTTPKVKSVYEREVIDVNKALRQTQRNIGKATALLLLMHNSTAIEDFKLEPRTARYLKAMKKQPAMYEALKRDCRRTKSGEVTPFYVLQAVKRQCDEQEKSLTEAKKAEAKKAKEHAANLKAEATSKRAKRSKANAKKAAKTESAKAA